jgi:hypothetical protein
VHFWHAGKLFPRLPFAKRSCSSSVGFEADANLECVAFNFAAVAGHPDFFGLG